MDGRSSRPTRRRRSRISSRGQLSQPDDLSRPARRDALSATTRRPPRRTTSPDQPADDYLPSGAGSALLRELMASGVRLRPRPPGQPRVGRPPASVRPTPSGSGARARRRLAAVRRAARQEGRDPLGGRPRARGGRCSPAGTGSTCPGATGYLDTDYAAKGRYGVEALKDHDLVCVHVEAPDEASHEGRADAKVEALERIDRDIVGPLAQALEALRATIGSWSRPTTPPCSAPRPTTAARSAGLWPAPACAGAGPDAYDEVSARGRSRPGLRARVGSLMEHGSWRQCMKRRPVASTASHDRMPPSCPSNRSSPRSLTGAPPGPEIRRHQRRRLRQDPRRRPPGDPGPPAGAIRSSWSSRRRGTPPTS